MLKNPVYRAICVYSDSATGEIRVQIPVLSGLTDIVPISYVGRAAYNGVWAVPSIGSQIVVTADDSNLTNVFWVQVAPDPATSLEVSELTNRVVELESLADAFFLGVFR